MKKLFRDKRIIILAAWLGILELLSYLCYIIGVFAPTGRVAMSSFFVPVRFILFIPIVLVWIVIDRGHTIVYFFSKSFNFSSPHWLEFLIIIILIMIFNYFISLLLIALLDFLTRKLKRRRMTLKIEAIFLSSLLILVLVFGGIGFVRGKPLRFAGSRDAYIKAKMSQLRTQAEMIFYEKGEDYSDFACSYNDTTQSLCDGIDMACSKGTAACGGDDAKGGVEEVIIHATTDKYCLYSPLTSPPGPNTYFCLDSSGGVGTTTINPSLPGYCDGITFVCPHD